MHYNLHEIYDLLDKTTGVSTDTRILPEGCIFIALKGERFDGNKFAMEALEKGAAYAIVDDESLKGSERLINVEDSLQTLQSIAGLHRQKYPVPLIAITGSNGKTTTKELISAVLGKRYKLVSTLGNLNNHIGVPLTILRMNSLTEIAVIEMGANHVGEIRDLCAIAQPTSGLITNIGKAHLEGFGGLEGIISAKSELYEYLQNSSGKVFVNFDDPLLMELSRRIDRVTYGMKGEASCTGNLLSDYPGIKGTIQKGTSGFNIVSPLYGSYNFVNILAAICIGLDFQISVEEIKTAIAQYSPGNMRSQIIETRHNKVYLDAYNANPSSMKNTLDYFGRMPDGSKVVILGDMLELGADSTIEHKKVLSQVGLIEPKTAIFVGEQFYKVRSGKPYLFFRNQSEVINWLKVNKIEGATILIKASRGIRLEQLMEVL